MKAAPAPVGFALIAPFCGQDHNGKTAQGQGENDRSGRLTLPSQRACQSVTMRRMRRFGLINLSWRPLHLGAIEPRPRDWRGIFEMQHSRDIRLHRPGEGHSAP